MAENKSGQSLKSISRDQEASLSKDSKKNPASLSFPIKSPIERAISMPASLNTLHVGVSSAATKWCATSQVFVRAPGKIGIGLMPLYYDLGVFYETRFRVQVDVMMFLYVLPMQTFTMGGMFEYMGKAGFMQDQYRDTIRMWCRDALDRMIALGFLTASASPVHQTTSTPTVLYAICAGNSTVMDQWLREWLDSFQKLGAGESQLISQWARYYRAKRLKRFNGQAPPDPKPFELPDLDRGWTVSDLFLDSNSGAPQDDLSWLDDGTQKPVESIPRPCSRIDCFELTETPHDLFCKAHANSDPHMVTDDELAELQQAKKPKTVSY